MVDVETGRAANLSSDVSFGLGIAIAPDGRTIYVSVQRLQADIWMVDLKPRK